MMKGRTLEVEQRKMVGDDGDEEKGTVNDSKD